MATQLFVRRPDNNLARGSSGSATPNTFQRSDVASVVYNGPLIGTRGATASNSATTATVAGPTAGVQMNWASGSLVCEWLTDPFDASTTISGTITFNIWALETNMAANAGLQVILDVIDVEGNVKGVTIIDSERGIELGTTMAVNNWTGTPTSTVVGRGERIRARFYINDVGTMAATYTCQFSCEGPTAAATGDTYITFTENITFASFAAGGTQYFASNTASDINPGANTEKELWTASGVNTTAVTASAAGYVAPIQATQTSGGVVLEWFTKQIAARTIDQAFFSAGTTADGPIVSATANAVLKFELAICDSDGTNPVVFVAHACSLDLPVLASVVTYQASVAFPTLSITDGQRIRYRVYLDDESTQAMLSAQTATIKYAGSTGLSVTLPALTEYVAAATRVPRFTPYPQLLAH